MKQLIERNTSLYSNESLVVIDSIGEMAARTIAWDANEASH